MKPLERMEINQLIIEIKSDMFAYRRYVRKAIEASSTFDKRVKQLEEKRYENFGR